MNPDNVNNNLDDVSMLWVMQSGSVFGEVILLEIVFAWARETDPRRPEDTPEERSKFLGGLLRCLMVEQAIRAEEKMALSSIFSALKDATDGGREPEQRVERRGPPRNRRDC